MLSGASEAGESSTTLNRIQDEYFPGSKSLALQMDIEGGEYEVLSSLTLKSLSNFNLLLIEFHNLDHELRNQVSGGLFSESIGKLSMEFDLVHTHPNNAGGFFLNKFRVYPRVVETTWVRKGLLEVGIQAARLPHPLDVPNDSMIWDLTLP